MSWVQVPSPAPIFPIFYYQKYGTYAVSLYEICAPWVALWVAQRWCSDNRAATGLGLAPCVPEGLRMVVPGGKAHFRRELNGLPSTVEQNDFRLIPPVFGHDGPTPNLLGRWIART